jgi:hypothetical protein
MCKEVFESSAIMLNFPTDVLKSFREKNLEEFSIYLKSLDKNIEDNFVMKKFL